MASTTKNYLSRDQETISSIFHERNPELIPHVEIGSAELTHGMLVAMRDNKNKKAKVKVTSIERLPSDIPYFNIGSSLSKKPTKRIVFVRTTDQTGLFLIKLSTGGEVVLSFRLFRVSKDYFVQRLFCTDSKTLRDFLKLFQVERAKQYKPPTHGVFVLQINQFGMLEYHKKKMPNPPVIHQQAAIVEKSIETYFQNKERYLRSGKSGAKRILLFGLPGGGKTTLCYQIARKYEKTHLVVFSSDVGSLAMHSANCSKYKIQTIIFNEECDRWMGGSSSDPQQQNISENVKAFLDGHLSHRNLAGEINILVTNYPERIERTILFRPGRIHERIEIGCLDEDHAVKVAKFYFTDSKGKLICDESELEFFKSNIYTGAQIENIAGLVIDYINGTDEKITKTVIEKVVNEFKDAVTLVRKYKDQKSLIDYDGVSHKPAGFSFGVELSNSGIITRTNGNVY